MDALEKLWPYAVGYSFAVLIAAPMIQIITQAMQRRERLSPDIPELRGTAYVPRILGIVKRTLYVAAILAGHPEFIGIWLALKVAGQWQVWNAGISEVSGRTIFSIFLIGSGLSIAYSYVGALVVAGLLENRYLHAFGLMILLPAATVALRLYIPLAGRRNHQAARW
jgi:hypothetical protein